MPATAKAASSTVRVDWTSQSFKQNPFPALARLCAAGPLVRTRVPLLGKVWIATTYDAVSELLRDHHRFTQNPATAGLNMMAVILWCLPRNLRPLRQHMLIRDEPDHRRLRSLVDQAFLRQHVEALRPRLVALADAALDQFAAELRRSPGGADLLAHFARPFPLAVICELLGLPAADRPAFTRWAAGITKASSIPGVIWGLRGLGKLAEYLREEIRRQSTRPSDGLLAALIQAEEAGDRLSEDELLAMVFLLLVAGHETTLHQITASVLQLFDHPEQLRELTSDWGLVGSAVQELLRYVSFAQFAKPRFAREHLEFAGQTIRRGQTVLACLASANTDPAQFPHPDQLDLRRQPNRHLAFGAGIHVCLGAKLASVETEIALERLFTRFAGIHLAVPRAEIQYTRRYGSRALTALPLRA